MIRKFKFVTAAAIIALAMPIAGQAKEAVPAEAAEGASTQPETVAAPVKDADIFGMLAKIFNGDDQGPPIAPAQIKMAEKAVGKLMPDGTLGKMIGGMVQKIITPIMETMPDMSATEIMNKTGIYDGVSDNLNDQSRKEITALLDPTRKERGQKAIDTMIPLLSKVMTAIEGPMRTGLSRAYARKFTAQQLTQINVFFATPAGSAYAAESYALQADPEVMRAMVQAMPVMFKQLKASASDLDKGMAALPKERRLADLNDTEMAKLAGLLNVPVASLEEQRNLMGTVDAAAQAAAAAGDAAGEAAAVDDSYANETGNEPWYDKENWAKGTKKKVDALSAAYEKISDKSSASYARWESAFNKAVADTRQRYLLEGWKPEAKAE
jgi:Uncharacterized protein conserved in bacteria (DUF2059)